MLNVISLHSVVKIKYLLVFFSFIISIGLSYAEDEPSSSSTLPLFVDTVIKKMKEIGASQETDPKKVEAESERFVDLCQILVLLNGRYVKDQLTQNMPHFGSRDFYVKSQVLKELTSESPLCRPEDLKKNPFYGDLVAELSKERSENQSTTSMPEEIYIFRFRYIFECSAADALKFLPQSKLGIFVGSNGNIITSIVNDSFETIWNNALKMIRENIAYTRILQKKFLAIHHNNTMSVTILALLKGPKYNKILETFEADLQKKFDKREPNNLPSIRVSLSPSIFSDNIEQLMAYETLSFSSFPIDEQIKAVAVLEPLFEKNEKVRFLLSESIEKYNPKPLRMAAASAVLKHRSSLRILGREMLDFSYLLFDLSLDEFKTLMGGDFKNFSKEDPLGFFRFILRHASSALVRYALLEFFRQNPNLPEADCDFIACLERLWGLLMHDDPHGLQEDEKTTLTAIITKDNYHLFIPFMDGASPETTVFFLNVITKFEHRVSGSQPTLLEKTLVQYIINTWPGLMKPSEASKYHLAIDYLKGSESHPEITAAFLQAMKKTGVLHSDKLEIIKWFIVKNPRYFEESRDITLFNEMLSDEFTEISSILSLFRKMPIIVMNFILNYFDTHTAIRCFKTFSHLLPPLSDIELKEKIFNTMAMRSSLRTTKPAPKPIELAPIPIEPAPGPIEPAPIPIEPAPKPIEPAPKPIEPAPIPIEPAPKPIEPAPIPIEPAPKPIEPAPGPIEPAPISLETEEALESLPKLITPTNYKAVIELLEETSYSEIKRFVEDMFKKYGTYKDIPFLLPLLEDKKGAVSSEAQKIINILKEKK